MNRRATMAVAHHAEYVEHLAVVVTRVPSTERRPCLIHALEIHGLGNPPLKDDVEDRRSSEPDQTAWFRGHEITPPTFGRRAIAVLFLEVGLGAIQPADWHEEDRRSQHHVGEEPEVAGAGELVRTPDVPSDRSTKVRSLVDGWP